MFWQDPEHRLLVSDIVKGNQAWFVKASSIDNLSSLPKAGAEDAKHPRMQVSPKS